MKYLPFANVDLMCSTVFCCCGYLVWFGESWSEEVDWNPDLSSTLY